MINPGIVDETTSKQFYRMAPDGVTAVKTSLGVKELDVADVTRGAQGIKQAAMELKRRGVGCIIIGGAPSVVTGGASWEREITKVVSASSGVPATTAQTAAVDALKHLGLGRVGVVTPFDSTFNDPLAAYLEAAGFGVAGVEHPNVSYAQLATIPLSVTYELGKRSATKYGQVDGIYFAGAPFPVVDVIAQLEAELGVAVVTSLQSALWRGLQLCGAPTEKLGISGYGRLLEQNPNT